MSWHERTGRTSPASSRGSEQAEFADQCVEPVGELCVVQGPAVSVGEDEDGVVPVQSGPCRSARLDQLAVQVSAGVAAPPFPWKPKLVEPAGAIAPL